MIEIGQEVYFVTKNVVENAEYLRVEKGVVDYITVTDAIVYTIKSSLSNRYVRVHVSKVFPNVDEVYKYVQSFLQARQ